MNSKEDKALRTFRSGFNCAQAVISAYSDGLKIDSGMAEYFKRFFIISFKPMPDCK